MTSDQLIVLAFQLIVLALLVLPLVGAIVVWILGPTRGPAIRATSVTVSVEPSATSTGADVINVSACGC